MGNLRTALLPIVLLALPAGARAGSAIAVPNAGFEELRAGGAFPESWQAGIGGGAAAAVESDEAVAHSGARSVRITNRTARKAFAYASFSSGAITVQPQTTYVMRFFAKGKRAGGCHASAAFQGDDERLLYLPAGDFEWREFSCRFTTHEGCSTIFLGFASDDVTEALWIDDVSLRAADRQMADLAERRYPKQFAGVLPRSNGPIARHLAVYDCSQEPADVRLMAAALQGIVNRRQPRIYLINPTNPAGYDEMWLKYMQEKGYTGRERRVADLARLVAIFRNEVAGLIVYDPDLPGSVNAASMLAGVKNAPPASPRLAERLLMPVVMDLRGKWRRSVDAYRWVYHNYWDRMNHHILSWEYPLSNNHCARDYMVEFNVFTFWLSTHADSEKGADPEAEEEFINELLADTPANVPVMGWPMYGDDKGLPEYSALRWLSEFGKFVPGTGYCSNLSVHSAIHPPDTLFRQKCREQPSGVELEKDKVYVSTNILDSGDALWYWQLHQRKIWADPARGAAPVGWCMNIALYDALPLVLQWYYENATPNDTFFAGPSGLGYMNTQAYAGRFRAADRERIWREYVGLTDAYCRRLDIDGVELYNGAWGERTPPSPETFRRFARGMSNLNYIIADLGRHDGINPANANSLLDGTAVFHTLTRFQVWSKSSEVVRSDMDNANAWLLDEIKANSPVQRPGFMSAMAISWYYYPSWLKDLKDKLPPHYVAVGPGDLARLFRERQRAGGTPGARQEGQ